MISISRNSAILTDGSTLYQAESNLIYSNVRFHYGINEGLFYKDTPIIPKSAPICMLPHSAAFQIAVMISIILHVYLVCITFTYDLDMTFSKNIIYVGIYYTLEVIYVAYLACTLLHRFKSVHKIDYCSRKMSFMQFFFGVLTIIPYYEIYEYLLMKDKHIWMAHIIQLKVTYRLYHVISYFRHKRAECALNRINIILHESAVIISLYICAISGVISWLGCYGCDFLNWTNHLKDVPYDNDNLQHRLIYPIVFIASILMGNYSSVLLPETIAEIIWVLITMVVGLVIKFNYLFAHLISEYVTYYYKSSRYKLRIGKIKNYIDSIPLSKCLENDIMEYYNVLWTKRAGITRWDSEFVNMLPSSIKNEIKLDLSWDALKHSQLFRDISLALKTEISKIMHNRFMCRGSVIHDTGDLKDSFIYIISGLVQLLSDEDDESPVMTFSSGTVISEFACLLLCRSKSRLQCASYCELRVLSFADFYRGMCYRQADLRQFQQVLQKRIDLGRRLLRTKSMINEGEECQSRPIRRVKLQWHQLVSGTPLVNHTHTSKYMDLLALKSEMDVKVEVVCLTSKFPLIMDPNSSFRQFCEIIVITACLIETAIIPYYTAFPREITPAIRSFFILLDIVYVLDIYLQVTTAIEMDDIMIVKFASILLRRCQQLTFLVDLLAILPVDYIEWALQCTPRTFIVLKVPRVIKIYKLIKLAKLFEKRILDVNNILQILLKYYLLWFIGVYFFTCIFYALSCYSPECARFSWYAYNIELSNQTSSGINPAITSLHYVIDLFCTAQKTIYAYSYLDNIIMLMFITIGYYLLIISRAELSASHYWKMHEAASYKALVSAVIQNTRIHQNNLVERVLRLMEFRWTHTNGLIHRCASEFLSELPTKLEERAREEMIGVFIDRQILFHSLNEPTRRRVLQVAQLISYPQGGIIVRAEEAIHDIYIIKRGKCRASSQVPGDLERKTNIMLYSTGNCFPIIEVLHRVPSFLNVVALTAVDAIVIKYDDFIRTIIADIVYYNSLMESLKLHKKAHAIIFLKPKDRQCYIYQFKKQKNFFTYEIDDQLEVEEKKRNILMRTINPHSKWYFAYEVIRCLLALFQFAILCLQMNVLHEHRYSIQSLNAICDLLSWLDIAVRCRLHYYRSDGILVTNYKSVMKYYLKHSFAVDFYACWPFYILPMGTMSSINHPVVISQLILLLSRPFQLYRVFLGIKYLGNSTKLISEVNLVRIQLIIFVVVILSVWSNLLVLSICDIDYDNVICPMDGWAGGDITEITTKTTLVHYLYLSAMYLHESPINHYAKSNNYVYIKYVFYTVISMLLGWYLISKLISLDLHGQFMTMQLQSARKNFQLFANIEGIREKLSEKLLQVNAFMTRDTGITALEEAERQMTPQLLCEVSATLNQATLLTSRLFYDRPEHVQRDIANRFKRTIYMKDDFILRINDINQYLYMVQSGCVAVTVAGCELASLTQGGMFGCISDKQRIRQTIDVKATMHSELIYIETIDFNRFICPYAFIKNRMKNLITQHVEYVEPILVKANLIVRRVVYQAPPAPKRIKPLYFLRKMQKTFKIAELNLRTKRFIRTINDHISLFNKSQRGFRIYYYVLHVHLSMLSTMFVLIYQMLAMQKDLTPSFIIIFYLLDVIFSTKILLGFFVPYVDETSGLVVRDHAKIIKRYASTEFTLDLMVVLPLELIFGFIFGPEILISNRLLRIVFLISYYNTTRMENRLTHGFRWIFLAYITIIYIQFLTNIWHFVACIKHECRYRKFISHEPEEYRPVLTNTHAYLISYIHVLNYFTGNSLNATKPLNIEEIILTTVIVVSSLFMIARVSSGYALVQVIDNAHLSDYRNKLIELRTYLANLHLSPCILKRVVRYYEFLWRHQRGQQMPHLITDTRRYIHEDIISDLYSKLILGCAVFENAHKDFLRQLLLHVKRMVYPRSTIIVEQHVTNGKMYFIECGIIQVVEETAQAEINTICTLQSGQCFGEVQGLLGTPHNFTYIAETLVVIIYLKKEDWQYLLEFFPATYENIQQNIEDYHASINTIR